MTPREKEIVKVLADSVRVLSIDQVASAWWSETRWGRSRAKSALSGLVHEGWLHVQQALSRPVLQLTAPIVEWRPEQIQPDLNAAALKLHRRAMTHAIPQTVYYASSKAVCLFGSGRAPTIKLTQMTHDLHVSEVYLHYRTQERAAEDWVSEDRLPRDWLVKVRPDAAIRDHEGSIARAVEYGGDYPVSRLIEIHEQLASVGIGYELW